jgi:hypothetical protein
LRSAISATTAALVLLAGAALAAAADSARDAKPPAAPANAAATTATKKEPQADPGIVPLQDEDAIPYQPCINARGWVDGRLECTN